MGVSSLAIASLKRSLQRMTRASVPWSSALPATGTVSRDKDGRLQLVMKILDRKSGATADSTATLSKDGMVLFGKTSQLFVVEGDGKRRSATVDYEWVAQKFAGSAKAARK